MLKSRVGDKSQRFTVNLADKEIERTNVITDIQAMQGITALARSTDTATAYGKHTLPEHLGNLLGQVVTNNNHRLYDVNNTVNGIGRIINNFSSLPDTKTSLNACLENIKAAIKGAVVHDIIHALADSWKSEIPQFAGLKPLLNDLEQAVNAGNGAGAASALKALTTFTQGNNIKPNSCNPNTIRNDLNALQWLPTQPKPPRSDSDEDSEEPEKKCVLQ